MPMSTYLHEQVDSAFTASKTLPATALGMAYALVVSATHGVYVFISLPLVLAINLVWCVDMVLGSILAKRASWRLKRGYPLDAPPAPQPWSSDKMRKGVAKWLLWMLVAGFSETLKWTLVPAGASVAWLAVGAFSAVEFQILMTEFGGVINKLGLLFNEARITRSGTSIEDSAQDLRMFSSRERRRMNGEDVKPSGG